MKRHRTGRLFLLIALWGCFFASEDGQAKRLTTSYLKSRPKLVLTLVIDQFRADYLTRFLPRFLPARKGKEVGGFAFLMENGAYFPDTKFEVFQNMTGPGHATVLTGAYPYAMGIPNNGWYDVERQQPVYCVEDPTVATVGATPTDSHIGSSPRNLFGSTVGDELKNAGLSSRVVTIALKDRAAILLGGHRADLALWLDSSSFRWVSSKHYLSQGVLPPWVDTLNRELEAKKGQEVTWQPSGSPLGLSVVGGPMPAPGRLLAGVGSAFPHAGKVGSTSSLVGPFGLEMTEIAAERAVESMELGKNGGPDVLAVSFSSHDYAGHTFGPNSLELEEMTVAADRVLSRFFNFLHRKVPGGLGEVMIVLTADHGAPANPDWPAKERFPAGRLDETKLVETVENALVAKFGKASSRWVLYQNDLNFYLSPQAIGERGQSREAVEHAAEEALLAVPGVRYVVSGSDVKAGVMPPGFFGQALRKTYFRGRSGDVIVVPQPYFLSGEGTVNHLTAYQYDRSVPLIMAGTHFAPGVYTKAHVVDIAPTLAFVLGILPPAMSEGHVLDEALAENVRARPAKKGR